MRVLHISDNDGVSGASRAAFRIHHALRDIGVDSHMLVEYKSTRDPTVHAACGLQGLPGRLLFALRGEIDLFPLRHYPRRKRSGWVRGELRRGLPRLVRKLTPDVVHLHWMGTLGPIRELPLLGFPTVWSLHDAYAFTGGCCYPGACQRFMESCGQCPTLGSRSSDDLSAQTLRMKQKKWRDWNLLIVGSSDWMTGMSKTSAVFSNKEHATVFNGVDLTVFSPRVKQSERRLLGLPSDRRLVLFGASSLNDPRKGGDLLIEALQKLQRREGSEALELVTFGRDDQFLKRLAGWKVHSFGLVNDSRRLASLYKSADLTVVPSREDNCPQVLIESLACGTPVAAFNATGLKDLIDDGVTGRLAKPFDPVDLARIISELLQLSEPERLAMRERCRKVAVERFSIERTAKQYLSLCEERLEKRTVL